MKLATSIIAGLAFMLSTQLFAEGDGKKGKGDMRAKILEKFDTNNDGQLDETEKEALKKAMAERRASGEGKGDRAKKGKRDGVEKEGGVEPVRP